MKKIIRLKDVSKYFITKNIKTTAVNKASIEIKQGDFIVVEGVSGSGKSSLLNILGLLTKPSTGVVEFNGRNVDSLSINDLTKIRNQHIGFIFQNFNLIGDLSVLDNVALPLKYGGVNKNERNERALDWLTKLGIESRKNHYPALLSGGQQQRVAIARAMVNNPDIILADEPTGNLDEENAKEIINIFKELNSAGTTFCIVTHSKEVAEQASRRVNVRNGELHEK